MASKIVKNTDLVKEKSYINGEFVSAKDGTTFSVSNPATGETLANVSDCTVDEALKAVDAAVDAFKSFKNTTPRSRAKLLRKWYDLMIENAETLAQLISLENGKPLAEAKGEVNYSASFLEWFSEEAPRIGGETMSTTAAANRLYTLKQPVGPVAVLTPWNFPSAMITRKVGAAIAAGCTIVAKPAAETPLSCLALAELAERAGFPKGVFNVVTTDRALKDVGKALCEHPKIKKVSFTGSTAVGKHLMGLSASSMKKLSFELGGNAPFIVFDDADLDAAVDGAIACKFRHTGQTCICANRIFVHEKIYDEFAKKLVEKVKNFKLGAGMESSTTHGPLIHSRAVEKVDKHVKDAVSKSAKVLTGGKPANDIGSAFYNITVLSDVNKDMLCMQEETFGPLAALVKFSSEKDVLEQANDIEVGLAGYFFSENISRVYRVAESLEVGMVGVNTGAISDPAMPFGGVKESGFGREGARIGVDEYTVLKSVTVAIKSSD